MPRGIYERSVETRAKIAAARRGRSPGPNVAKFWSKVDKSGGPEACWPWTGATNELGYGVTQFDGRAALAHRKAWALTNGPIPDDKLVCHRCDSPPCCNPAHHFLGTNADNMADMAAKGRARCKKLGVDGASRALDRIDAGESQASVCRDMGVSPSTLYHWRRRLGRLDRSQTRDGLEDEHVERARLVLL